MVPSSRGCERALLKGISNYSKYHGPWIFYMDLPDYVSKGSFKKKMDWLKDIRAEGIVARVPYLYTFDELIATKLPLS